MPPLALTLVVGQGQDLVRAARAGARDERLRALKRNPDRADFLRLNQNMRP